MFSKQKHLAYTSNASVGSEISEYDKTALNMALSAFKRKNLKVLEIGSWVGLGSTQTFAEYSEILHCVDTWEGNGVVHHDEVINVTDPYNLFRENTKNLATKLISIHAKSEDALKLLPKNYFDAIFIDADHTYAGLKKDLNAAMPLLKENGILLGHDAEARFETLNPKLSSFLETAMKKDAVECDEIIRALEETLPDINAVDPRNYPTLTPLVKFKCLHAGVIKALSEFNFPKLYFSDLRLEDQGFWSIWVAKKRSNFQKNMVFHSIEKFINRRAESG